MKLSSTLAATILAATIALPASAALNPGNLPLWFEAGNAAQFTARGHGSQFTITTTGTEFTLRQADGRQTTARMVFLGGNPKSEITGDGQLPAKLNRFIGNEPAQWQSGLATFAKVRLEKIYPGINAVYYGNQEKLEYDFELAAGVKPEIIALRFDGIQKISVNAQGQLVIALGGGEITQQPPVAYQTIAGQRRSVAASYRILDSRTMGFAIGSYDHSQPLVIDPVFTTYFGGSSDETAWAVAVDPNDNSIYLAGQTVSTRVTNGVPFTKDAYDPSFNGGTILGDAFVAKFDSTGGLTYCTYLGGKGEDAAYAIAVDAFGHVFVTGITQSRDFPVRNPVVYGNFNGTNISGKIISTINAFPTDCFVTELEADGASLVYSTYLGGNKFESAFGIAVDPAGNAFVTGYTTSTNFPVTADAYQKHLMCPQAAYIYQNAFVTEIAAGGGQLNYSTFLGGTNYDCGLGIAYNNGYVVVVGETKSKNFPWVNGLTNNCRYLNGRTNQLPVFDAFVTQFTTNGTSLDLQYSTFLGSTNEDVATAVAVDANGAAYVVGWTTSTNFPIEHPISDLSSFVHTNKTGFAIATNAFLSIITNGPTGLTYSQSFGGRGQDIANGVALDGWRNIYVIGTASSTNFPVYNIPTDGTNSFSTNSCLRAKNSGASDAFVVAFDSIDSTNFLSATNRFFGAAYIGGKANDSGMAIAIDSTNIVIVGTTTSTNLPVSVNAYKTKRIGNKDTFISKFNFN